MASKSKRARMAPVRNLSKAFLYWAIAVFIVKLLIIFNIQGGTLACAQAGLPITHGKKVMSLERQVRIAAGFLVALGSLLGFFVDPRLGFISTFIGCGLMFAGVTDTCGMGMMLAKMPWNRVANNPSCSLPKT